MDFSSILLKKWFLHDAGIFAKAIRYGGKDNLRNLSIANLHICRDRSSTLSWCINDASDVGNPDLAMCYHISFYYRGLHNFRRIESSNMDRDGTTCCSYCRHDRTILYDN